MKIKIIIWESSNSIEIRLWQWLTALYIKLASISRIVIEAD